MNAYPTLVAIDKSGRIADYAIGRGPESENRIRQDIDRARAARLPSNPPVRLGHQSLRAPVPIVFRRR